MNYFIPTYEQAVKICNEHDGFNFFETKHIIDGYNISIFSYRLCSPELFFNPIENETEITAFELRGLTFVWNKDGSLYKRFLLMNKFFNLNQCDDSSYFNLKDEKIKEITYKEDGSILSFIELPNGKIIAKTKASFEADQAARAQELFDNSINIQKIIKWGIKNDIIVIMEFVSPSNRVVLKYDKTDLVVIKLRNNLTGEYISVGDLPSEITEGNTLVKTFSGLTLDELMSKCETDSGYEGYVVTFESGKMIKLKLLEYCALHNLHTEDLHREDSIIYLIINEQIDDIICQLEDGDERKTMVFDLVEVVNHYINRNYKETSELLKLYKGSSKEFFMENTKSPFIRYAMSVVNHGNDLLTVIKDRILKDTYFLFNARKWIDNEKKLMK